MKLTQTDFLIERRINVENQESVLFIFDKISHSTALSIDTRRIRLSELSKSTELSSKELSFLTQHRSDKNLKIGQQYDLHTFVTTGKVKSKN